VPVRAMCEFEFRVAVSKISGNLRRKMKKNRRGRTAVEKGGE